MAQFNIVADLNCWSSDERAKFLATSLSGPALNILASLTVEQRTSYDHLVRALEMRFGENKSGELALIKLGNRRKLPTETLSMYASDISSLVQLAYPTIGPEAWDLLA